jgi:hypothetical protein
LLYRKLEKEMQVQLPPLALPASWVIILRITGGVLIIGTLVFSLVIVNRFNYTRWLYLLPVVGILLTNFFSNLLDSERTVFCPAKLSDFTREVLKLNYSTMIQENGANRMEVELVINHIVADISGAEIKDVTAEKHLSDDLGIN